MAVFVVSCILDGRRRVAEMTFLVLGGALTF